MHISRDLHRGKHLFEHEVSTTQAYVMSSQCSCSKDVLLGIKGYEVVCTLSVRVRQHRRKHGDAACA